VKSLALMINEPPYTRPVRTLGGERFSARLL